MSDIAIELKGIDKSFGPVHANRDINLRVRKGTIHGIIGENGAGKSTLMSILYGFYQADRGDILVDGKKTAISLIVLCFVGVHAVCVPVKSNL